MLHPSLINTPISPIIEFNEIHCYPLIKMILIIGKQLSFLLNYINAKHDRVGRSIIKEDKTIYSLKHEEVSPRIYPFVKDAKRDHEEQEVEHIFIGK